MRRLWQQCMAAAISVGGVAMLLTVACAKPTHAPTAAPETSVPRTAATSTATVAPSPPAILPSPANAAAATAVPTSAPSPAQATIVYRGDTSRRMVALTFDAGADTGYTGEILATLRNEGIRATFGVTGAWAERNQELVVAIAADGHRLINHTYDHDSFTGLSTARPPLTAEERALELSRAETAIDRLTQRSTRPYFRPPYADLDASVQRDVAANGYSTIVMWSVDSLGWKQATADAIVARCLENAAPGAIYLMHVGSASQDAAALPRVIAGLRAAGYSFGTVDDVLAAG